MPDVAHGNFALTTVDDLLGRARELLALPGRTLIGVTGAPGSGKSTVTDALRAALGDSVVVVPMDGFHLSNEILVGLGRRDRKGAPDTFDVAGYVSLLRRIRDREDDLYAPRFDRGLEQSIGSAQHVPATIPLVVTEGNYLLNDSGGWEHVRPMLDEVWFLDVDPDEIRQRLVKRRLSYGESEEAARAWVASVDEPNGHMVIASRHKADLVVRFLEDAPDRTVAAGAHYPKDY